MPEEPGQSDSHEAEEQEVEALIKKSPAVAPPGRSNLQRFSDQMKYTTAPSEDTTLACPLAGFNACAHPQADPKFM